MRDVEYDDVVQNIKIIISEKGMKQTVVAERAGFSDSDFSNMLNERRKLIRIEHAGEGIDVTTRIGQEAWRVRTMRQERIRSKRRRFRVFRRRLQIRLQKKICGWIENEGPKRLKRKLITDAKEIAAGVAFGLVFGSVIVGVILIYCRMAGPF